MLQLIAVLDAEMNKIKTITSESTFYARSFGEITTTRPPKQLTPGKRSWFIVFKFCSKVFWGETCLVDEVVFNDVFTRILGKLQLVNTVDGRNPKQPPGMYKSCK